MIATNIAEFFARSRQYDRAIDQCRKAIDMNPNFARAHDYLITAYRLKGMYEEAFTEYLKFLALYSVSPEIVAGYKEAYLKLGWKGVFQKWLDIDKEQAKVGYVRAWPFFSVYDSLGVKTRRLNGCKRHTTSATAI